MKAAARPSAAAWSCPFTVTRTRAGSARPGNSTFRSNRLPARISARSSGKITCAAASPDAPADARSPAIKPSANPDAATRMPISPIAAGTLARLVRARQSVFKM